MNFRATISFEHIGYLKLFFYLKEPPEDAGSSIKGLLHTINSQKQDSCFITKFIRVSEVAFKDCRLVEISRQCNEHFSFYVKNNGDVKIFINFD